MKLFAYYSTFNIPLNHEKIFTKIYVFSTKKMYERLSYFVLKTSLVVQQNTTMFFSQK